MLDAEGLEIVDLAPGAALVEQRERLAHDAAFGVEGLAAPFGRQPLKGDDMEQLCENGGRDVAADLDRCGNAISHDSLHRSSGECGSEYSCQVSGKRLGPASLPGPSFDCKGWMDADYSAATGSWESIAAQGPSPYTARTEGRSP